MIEWQAYVPAAVGVSVSASFSRAPKRGRSAFSSEYLEPLRRFKEQKIQDTVVFFGSARVDSRERAERALATLRARGVHDADEQYEAELTKSSKAVEWARYYEEARELARAAHALEPHAPVRPPSLRRDVGRRAGHHGGRQPRRVARPAARRSASTSGCRSSRAPIRTSPTACTSSSTTSSCASSGSRTWRRRS